MLLVSSHGTEHEVWFDENGVKSCFSVFAHGVRERFMETRMSQQQSFSQAENKNECKIFLSCVCVVFCLID